jgi:hypothetical protein
MKKYNLDIIVIPGPESSKFANEQIWFGGQKFVEMQKELFSMQNKDINFRWNMGFLNEQLIQTHLFKNDDTVRFFSYDINQLNIKFKRQPSSQHGSLLNNVIKEISDDHFKYVLVLDPDFFIFNDNWVSSLIEYMERKQLSILGASYPETDPRFYFDFPTAYFSLIDSSKIALNELNYLPDENQYEKREDEPWQYGFSLEIGNYQNKKVSLLFNYSLSRSVASFFLWRNKKNLFRDTGWEIRKKFKKSRKHEEFLFINSSDLSTPFSTGKRNIIKGVDIDWYLDNNEDVKKARMDPVVHYYKYGRFEGRAPAGPHHLNSYSYISQIRPHMKIKIMAYLEKFFKSEFSILPSRAYTMINFIQDFNSKFILFKGLPPAAAYYFFFDDFVSVHLGHFSKQQKPEEIKKIIFEFYSKFKS